MLQCLQLGKRLEVPELDLSRRAARRESAAVGSKGNRPHCKAVSVEPGPDMAVGQVPDKQFAAGVGCPVSATGEQPLVTGREIRAVDLLLVLAPACFLSPGLRIPEFDKP